MPTVTTPPPPRTLHHVLFAGLVFGGAMGVLLGLQTGSAYYGFHGGFLSGAAFAWILAKFLKVSVSTNRLELDGRAAGFDAGEVLLHHGPANHWKGAESVGGKLFLTSKRLRFRSHKLNVQSHDESYPVADIVDVEPVRTLGIVPNGVRVSLRDGRQERFVVMGRAAWLERLHASRARSEP